jgi:NAD(P)H dehydrogenase (quinone)
MILVTGAAGKTGRAVVAALVARGAPVRAWLRAPHRAAELIAMGVRETVTGSMADPETVARAVKGCEAVYFICPNVSPDEETFGELAIAAAQRAGVMRFVYHSVLHPQIEAMPHHWRKMRVEEKLFASSLDTTILQPTAYMQNLLAGWETIARDGVHRTPYPVTAPISLVDLDDLAEVAAQALCDNGHAGATYELVGTLPLSQTEVATILGGALGRPVTAEEEALATWQAGARAGGLGEAECDTLSRMFRYYAAHGLKGHPRVLTALLGRPPTTLAQFAARVAQA